MDNVVSFSKVKKQKQERLSNNIFEEMDAKFRGDRLSTKDKLVAIQIDKTPLMRGSIS